ncbi:MAG: MBOAT family protein [Lachnospiraceae bacterium]|nr:MBOAT family protein [Lachnospiraceae bacterium]
MLLASCIFNLFWAKLLLKKKNKALLAAGIVINVLPLLAFKYLNFFAVTLAHLAGGEFTAIDIIAPVAISYYTFQMITWTVDSYRGETAAVRVLDYLEYVWFFPRMIMGPITRQDEFVPQINEHKRYIADPENIATGFVWFTVGMSKKLLLASRFAGAGTYGFVMGSNLSMAEGWLCSIAYTFQIYLDFSGYCDMAAGVARMFNIDIPKNFDSPYKAYSIGDFWKRWHISLTSFLRKYIYFPLGGNRKGKVRTYLNMLAIFVISGFWHGANWTFILWGALHGVLMVIERLSEGFLKKIPKFIRVGATFILVNIGWIFFAAPDIGSAFTFIGEMFRPDNILPAAGFYDTFDMGTVPFIRFHLNLAIPAFYVLTFAALQLTKNIYEKKYKPNLRTAAATAVLFVWSFLYANAVSDFIYFKF